MSLADMQAQVARLQADAAIRRARNRAASPEFAEFVDSMRAKFGDVKVRYVRWADGTEEGKPGPRGVPISPIVRKK